jgi:hypothetical protein
LAVFRVARSLRIDLDMLVAPALKNPPRRNLRRKACYFGDTTQEYKK